MRKRVIGAVVVILALLSTGCFPDIPSGKPGKTDPAEEEAPSAVEPFTGTPAKGKAHPVVMVMVNNQRQARPQTGLNRADWVAEILAEGEITRFAAFYHSNTDGKVGPVRSVRPYYLDLVKGTGAVVAHAGGSPEALRKIQKESLPSLDGIHGDHSFFERVSFRQAPHNLYTSVEQLIQGAEKKGYQAEPTVKSPFRFDESGAVSQGKPAEKIDIQYHRLYEAGYRYHDAFGTYIRYTQGEKQVDRETRKPLSTKNVFVIFAKHRIKDASGRREVDLKGSGKGYLFQRGRGIPVKWENRDGWIVPVVKGKVVPFLPGNTWLNVVPEGGRVSFK